MTGYGRFVAALQPAPTKNVLLRVNQFKLFADPQRALNLAKSVVRAKIAKAEARALKARGGKPEAMNVIDLGYKIFRLVAGE